MKNIEIGIIGFGVVGKAVYNTFTNKFNVTKYDKYMKLSNFTDLKKCNFVFVAVPTPFNYQKNIVDDSAILKSLENLEKMDYSGIVIVKSTIPPGSCKKYKSKFNLRIVFNPEFLRESTTPNEDFENQDTIVIGTDNLETFESVKKMYQVVSVPHAHYYHTTPIEAEMIKYAQNTMLASRIVLANIIFDACQNHKIDYNKLRDIAFDRFEILGPHMVQVPGPDGKRGFGGKCLPKDILGFSTVHKSEIIKDIIKYNESLRDDLSKVIDNYKK